MTQAWRCCQQCYSAVGISHPKNLKAERNQARQALWQIKSQAPGRDPANCRGRCLSGRIVGNSLRCFSRQHQTRACWMCSMTPAVLSSPSWAKPILGSLGKRSRAAAEQMNKISYSLVGQNWSFAPFLILEASGKPAYFTLAFGQQSTEMGQASRR